MSVSERSSRLSKCKQNLTENGFRQLKVFKDEKENQIRFGSCGS